MTTPANELHKGILTSFIREVWSNGEVGRCDAYLAQTYTIHHDPGDPWHGQTLDVAGFINRNRISRASFPDQQFHVREMVADEDRVAVTWLWTGTHTGDYPGFPATGKPITMSGATIYYFDSDNRITGHWQITDRLSVYQQLERARHS